jgi:hypothetical protein
LYDKRVWKPAIQQVGNLRYMLQNAKFGPQGHPDGAAAPRSGLKRILNMQAAYPEPLAIDSFPDCASKPASLSYWDHSGMKREW